MSREGWCPECNWEAHEKHGVAIRLAKRADDGTMDLERLKARLYESFDDEKFMTAHLNARSLTNAVMALLVGDPVPEAEPESETLTPTTEAGKAMMREHTSGSPHMVRHVLAIEREARAEGHGASDAKAIRLQEERDAWKRLHDAKGHGPYGYADQNQLREIEAAEAVLGRRSPAESQP